MRFVACVIWRMIQEYTVDFCVIPNRKTLWKDVSTSTVQYYMEMHCLSTVQYCALVSKETSMDAKICPLL